LISVPLFFLKVGNLSSYTSIFLQAAFFVSLVHVNQETVVYKLLRTYPAKILGACSYSTYVLHGAILHICISIANMFYPIKNATPPYYWMIIACTAVVVVFVSILSYRFVEHPFMYKKVNN
jgi:peptidoglycan/LPS O-acetylase OafA/YrhL